MTDSGRAFAFQNGSGSPGLERAVAQGRRLLMEVEAFATMLAELGDIELPPAARAEPMQMRAVASLYLASALESAGLIDVADDFVRLMRSGVIRADIGEATDLVSEFWKDRTNRIAKDERGALFARLFGTPSGPIDTLSGVNLDFDELMLDLCDAIMDAADAGPPARVRTAGLRLAENVASTVNDTVLMMAREIMDELGRAVKLLGHADVRAAMNARSLWDVVAGVDRRMRRRIRPTLNHLRRGRAGMTVLAWLADVLDRLEGGGAIEAGNDTVLAAAVDWVDETLSLVQADDSGSANDPQTGLPPRDDAPSWRDLAR